MLKTVNNFYAGTCIPSLGNNFQQRQDAQQQHPVTTPTSAEKAIADSQYSSHDQQDNQQPWKSYGNYFQTSRPLNQLRMNAIHAEGFPAQLSPGIPAGLEQSENSNQYGCFGEHEKMLDHLFSKQTIHQRYMVSPHSHHRMLANKNDSPNDEIDSFSFPTGRNPIPASPSQQGHKPAKVLPDNVAQFNSELPNNQFPSNFNLHSQSLPGFPEGISKSQFTSDHYSPYFAYQQSSIPGMTTPTGRISGDGRSSRLLDQEKAPVDNKFSYTSPFSLSFLSPNISQHLHPSYDLLSTSSCNNNNNISNNNLSTQSFSDDPFQQKPALNSLMGGNIFHQSMSAHNSTIQPNLPIYPWMRSFGGTGD